MWRLSAQQMPGPSAVPGNSFDIDRTLAEPPCYSRHRILQYLQVCHTRFLLLYTIISCTHRAIVNDIDSKQFHVHIELTVNRIHWPLTVSPSGQLLYYKHFATSSSVLNRDRMDITDWYMQISGRGQKGRFWALTEGRKNQEIHELIVIIKLTFWNLAL